MHYVFSDVHGLYDRYYKMIDTINKRDTNAKVIILGDVVDRGPYGVEILIDIMRRLDKGENIELIMGNHEQMMLATLDSEYAVEKGWEELAVWSHVWMNNGGRSTLEAFGSLRTIEKQRVLNFLKSLKYTKELSLDGNNILLVHGGHYGSDISNYFKCLGELELVWNRPVRDNEKYCTSYDLVVVGHTPVTHHLDFSSDEQYKIYKDTKNKFIDIDCACARSRDPKSVLGCLVLETMEEIYVK